MSIRLEVALLVHGAEAGRLPSVVSGGSGSVTDYQATGTSLIVWEVGDDSVVIWRSLHGAHVEEGDLRWIESWDRVLIATLHATETFILTYHARVKERVIPTTLRFRVLADDAADGAKA